MAWAIALVDQLPSHVVRPLFLDDAWQLLEEFSGHCKAERLVSRTRKQSPRPPASAQAAEIIDQTCAKLDALEQMAARTRLGSAVQTKGLDRRWSRPRTSDAHSIFSRKGPNCRMCGSRS